MDQHQPSTYNSNFQEKKKMDLHKTDVKVVMGTF